MSKFKEILEATVTGGYPNDGYRGVASDDDLPTGNIVYGEKYKRIPFFNRLTSFQKNWIIDNGPWDWDQFRNCVGMEDLENYSKTLDSMKDLFPGYTWKNIWKRMREVPDDTVQADYKKGLEKQKDVENQLGKDTEPHYSFKKAGVTEESIETRINFIL